MNKHEKNKANGYGRMEQPRFSRNFLSVSSVEQCLKDAFTCMSKSGRNSRDAGADQTVCLGREMGYAKGRELGPLFREN